ncbi:MAG TPA: FAD-binding protein [Gemmatimonadaceae bacterium]|nr:FAD-binding protein [Gemmatimonadaceae bacterium]
MSATIAASDSRTTHIVDRVLAARAAHMPLRIQGAGTWMRAGRPTDIADTLSVAADRGIIEYVPGDLTITVRAGTTLDEVAAATEPHAQWLPLDPWGGNAGTIGATLATATSGPHSHAFGLPRDVALGVEVVTGSGQVVRAGGRVVKNVAGFDLTRLMIGAWGTLGVITEATLRLRARPEVTRTVAIELSAATALADVVTRLRALPFAPLACEVLHAGAAALLGFDAGDVLIARLGGNARAVASQLDLMRALGTMSDVPEDVWSRLRQLGLHAAGEWRWSQLPSAFANTWSSADRSARQFPGSLRHGSPMRGVVRVVIPGTAGGDHTDMASGATGFDGTVAVDVLPPTDWARVAPGVAQDPLSRSIRAKFDPEAILNRGILGAHA